MKIKHIFFSVNINQIYFMNIKLLNTQLYLASIVNYMLWHLNGIIILSYST